MSYKLEIKTRSRKLLFILGIGIVALSLVLFATGITTGDRPGMLVFAAFALLAALSPGLLAVIYQTLNIPISTRHPGDKREKGVTGSRETGVGSGKPDRTSTRKDPASAILAATAGELRTSVAVIEEELEEILDDEIPADKEHIESLYNETDRIRKIIAGMEQLSQAQALARSLTKVSVNLETLLNDVIEKTRVGVQDKDVAFSLECEPGLTMTADPDCLAWIMGNLVDNAAKAVKDAGNVTVIAKRNADEVVFSVKDTGTGIRRSHIPHLFERFFRGAGSGIGMGLAIVKELLDACGGKIKVETESGKGTSFTVHFPAE